MNFFDRNELELTEKLLLSEGGGVSEVGVNYCSIKKKTMGKNETDREGFTGWSSALKTNNTSHC